MIGSAKKALKRIVESSRAGAREGTTTEGEPTGERSATQPNTAAMPLGDVAPHLPSLDFGKVTYILQFWLFTDLFPRSASSAYSQDHHKDSRRCGTWDRGCKASEGWMDVGGLLLPQPDPPGTRKDSSVVHLSGRREITQKTGTHGLRQSPSDEKGRLLQRNRSRKCSEEVEVSAEGGIPVTSQASR